MGTGYLRGCSRGWSRRASWGSRWGCDRLQAALAGAGLARSRRLPAVHIAGTNGKGSTAAMAESILRAAGPAHGPLHLAAPLPLHRAHPDRRARGRRRPRWPRWTERLEATGVPLTYFEVATALGVPGHGRGGGRGGGAGGGAGRAAGRHQRLPAGGHRHHQHRPRPHRRPGRPRWRPSPGRRRASPSPGVPLYLGALPPEAEAAVRQVAAAVRAPVGRLGVDLRPAPVAPGAGRAAPAAQRRPGGGAGPGGGARPWAARCPAAPVARGPAPGGLAGAARAGGARRAARRRPQPGGGRRRCWRRCPPQRPRALLLSVVRGKPAAEMLARWRRRFDGLVLTRSHNPRAHRSRASWRRCCPPARGPAGVGAGRRRARRWPGRAPGSAPGRAGGRGRIAVPGG